MHENCKTIERIKQFADGRLCGIVSLPDDVEQRQTAVLVLNAGMLHRSGPFRANTSLCRSLSSKGFICLRFDLSNIGDSLPYTDQSEQEAPDISDIRAALDLLQNEYDIRQFVVAGLCTGADNAHKAALADERIIGVVMMDGYGFATPRFYLRRFTRLLLDPVRLFKVGKDLLRRDKQDSNEPMDFVWVMPEKSQVEKQLSILIQRDVKMLYTYTGAVRNYYNYPQQMADTFPALALDKQLQVQCYPDADHTMTVHADRHKILNDISAWLQQQFA